MNFKREIINRIFSLWAWNRIVFLCNNACPMSMSCDKYFEHMYDCNEYDDKSIFKCIINSYVIWWISWMGWEMYHLLLWNWSRNILETLSKHVICEPRFLCITFQSVRNNTPCVSILVLYVLSECSCYHYVLMIDCWDRHRYSLCATVIPGLEGLVVSKLQ